MSFNNTEQIDSFDVTRDYGTNRPRDGYPSIIRITTVPQAHGIFSTFFVVFGEEIPSFPAHLGYGAVGTGQNLYTPQYYILLLLGEFVPIMTLLSSGKTLHVIYTLTLDPFDPTNEGKPVYVDAFDFTSNVAVTPHLMISNLLSVVSAQ